FLRQHLILTWHLLIGSSDNISFWHLSQTWNGLVGYMAPQVQDWATSIAIKGQLTRKQGSQVSRIERDSHSFRSLVTHSRHTSYFSRRKKTLGYLMCSSAQT